jgi:hypothetical protein
MKFKNIKEDKTNKEELSLKKTKKNQIDLKAKLISKTMIKKWTKIHLNF